jgi:hypothetical protein
VKDSYDDNTYNLDDLLAFMGSRSFDRTPIDLVIDEWVKKSEKKGFIFAPSLVQHMGVSSSLSYKRGVRITSFKSSLTFKDDYFAP